MTRVLIAISFCLCAAVGGAAERLPSDSRWAVHLDIQAALSSQVGAAFDIRKRLGQAELAKLKMLEALTGLDPWRDLRSITVCAPDLIGDSAVILIRGTFQAEKLVTIAQAAEGYAAVAAGPRIVHTWAMDGKPAAACLVAPDLLLIGKTPARLMVVLGDLDSKVPLNKPVVLPSAGKGILLAAGAVEGLGAMIPQSGSRLAPSGVADPAHGDGAHSIAFSALNGGTRELSATLSEIDRNLVLEARVVASEENMAKQMLDAGRGLIALSQLAEMSQVPQALLRTLRSARLERDGVTLTLSLNMPLVDLQHMVEQLKLLER